jgi:hypothetical protein
MLISGHGNHDYLTTLGAGGDQISQAGTCLAHLNRVKFLQLKIRPLDACKNIAKKIVSLDLYVFLFLKWHIKVKPGRMNSHQWLRNETLLMDMIYHCLYFLQWGEGGDTPHLLLTFLFKKCKWWIGLQPKANEPEEC